MSQALVQSQDCCAPCVDIPITQVPGPAGPAGADGTDGTDGSSAFTTTTAGFIMPAVSGNVTVAVLDTAWMAVGQIIFVANAGYFSVNNVISGVSVSLTNLGYDGNAAPAAAIPTAQKVSSGGKKGVGGSSGSQTLNDLSPTNAKGDILVDSGANNPDADMARFARGSDGQVLTSLASQPLGLLQQTLLPNGATDNVLPRFDASGTTVPTPLQSSGVQITDTAAIQTTAGNARGTSAVDLQPVRGAATQVASGANSIIPGGFNNTASGVASVAVGTDNLVSGDGSSSLGNANTVSGDGAVALGNTNAVTGVGGAALGGTGATVDATNYGTTVGGSFNTASGDYSVAMGRLCIVEKEASIAMGLGCLVDQFGDYALASGNRSKANLYSQRAHGSGVFTDPGDAQTADLVFRIATTDATANVEMFLDGGTNPWRATMIDFGSWGFHILTVARNLSNGLSAVWESKGGIKRPLAGPGSLIGTVDHALICDDGEGWMIAGAVVVDYDNPNVALRIRVTGAIATDIRWVSSCRLVQLADL
jgi:hypothetical protein